MIVSAIKTSLIRSFLVIIYMQKSFSKRKFYDHVFSLYMVRRSVITLPWETWWD